MWSRWGRPDRKVDRQEGLPETWISSVGSVTVPTDKVPRVVEREIGLGRIRYDFKGEKVSNF